jgi:Phage capsid protein
VADNFELIFQQTKSALQGMVREEEQQAEWKAWDFVGEAGLIKNRARQANTVFGDIKHARRWNKNDSYTSPALLIDQLDVLQALKDPKSTYLQAMAASFSRGKDETVLTNAFNPVLTGNDYPGSVGDIGSLKYYDPGECIVMNSDGTFSSDVDAGTGQTLGGIEVAKTTGATGLTPAKLKNLGTRFDNASVPQSNRHIVANSDQKAFLLSSIEFTSSLYQGKTPLAEGIMETYFWNNWMIHFIPSVRFAANAVETNATYPCVDALAFQRDALLWTNGSGLQTRVDQNMNYNYNVQLWAEAMWGCVRLQGPGVAKIVLLRSPVATAVA